MATTPDSQPPSGVAVGFTGFAAFIMMMVGMFHAIIGLSGIFQDDFLVVAHEFLLEFDVTVWGWLHLLAGVVVFVAAYGLFQGAVWARTIGVIMAVASGIANFGFIPYQPFWSITILALDVAVIWALTVHGRDAANFR